MKYKWKPIHAFLCTALLLSNLTILNAEDVSGNSALEETAEVPAETAVISENAEPEEEVPAEEEIVEETETVQEVPGEETAETAVETEETSEEQAVAAGDQYTVCYRINTRGFLARYPGDDASGATYYEFNETAGEDLTILPDIPTSDTLEFLGYSLDPYAAVPEYTAGQVIEDFIPETEKVVFYGVWKQTAVSFHLYPNGENAKVTADGAQHNYYSLTFPLGNDEDLGTFPDVEAVRSGYHFLTWSMDPDKLENNFDCGTEVYTYNLQTDDHGRIKDVYLYAYWGTDTTVTLTYDVNAEDAAFESGETVKIQELPAVASANKDVVRLGNNHDVFIKETPVREGYEFAGWSLEKEESEVLDDWQISGELSFAGTTELTLYAVWVRTEFTIVYDLNAGEDRAYFPVNSGQSDFYNQKVRFEDADYTFIYGGVPQREGYVFKRWFASNEEGITYFEQGASLGKWNLTQYSADGILTLHAEWEEGEYHRLILHLNGGIMDTEDETAVIKEDIATILYSRIQIENYQNLPGFSYAYTAVKPRMELEAWYSDPDFSGEPKYSYYDLNLDPDHLEDIELYAKWTNQYYGIRLNLMSEDAEILHDVSANSDGTVEWYSGQLDIPLALNVQLRRPGYVLLGWAASQERAEKGTVDYQNDKEYVFSKNGERAVLYAVWSTPKNYSLTYYLNGGTLAGVKPKSGNVPSKYSTVDGMMLLPENDRENGIYKLGYTFDGWYTDSKFKNGPVTEFSAAEGGNRKFYAKWTARQYTVMLNARGGQFKAGDVSGNPGYNMKTFTFGKKSAVNNAPTKAGYKFLGWTDEYDGDTVKYKNTTKYASYSEDGDFTVLYAVWEPITYTIKFYVNSASQWNVNSEGITTFKSNAVTYKYTVENMPVDEEGNPYFSISDMIGVQRDGYTFEGWYKTKGFKGAPYDDNVETELPEISGPKNLTLYAKWTGKEYRVTLDAKGGILKKDTTSYPWIAEKTYTVGKKTALNNAPTKSGYKFLGWAEESDPDTVKYKNATKYASFSADGEDVTLVAVWQPVKYTVTLNTNGGIIPPAETAKSTVKQTYTMDTLGDDGTFLHTNFGETIWKRGYYFGGWYDNSKFKGTPMFYDYQLKYNPKNIKLYAKWTPKAYTVTLNANAEDAIFSKDSTGNMDASENAVYTQVMTFGKSAMLADVPVRAGYKFMGWAETNHPEAPVVYKAGKKYNTYSYWGTDVTLYAVWQAN